MDAEQRLLNMMSSGRISTRRGGAGAARAAVPLMAGTLLVLANGFVHGIAWAAAVSDSAVSLDAESLSKPGESSGHEWMGLRSSETLAQPRAAGRARLRERPAPDAPGKASAVEPPKLRMQSSLATEKPSAGFAKQQVPFAGELNREGIVRASRIGIRDGTIVLEGAGDHPGSAEERSVSR
jgi:hypothetical protein